MNITIFHQINTPCTLADTLVSLGGPGENYRGFSAIRVIFDQFLPILRRLFHQKVLGAHLLGQACFMKNMVYVDQWIHFITATDCEK